MLVKGSMQLKGKKIMRKRDMGKKDRKEKSQGK